MQINKIYNEDCLEGMKHIDDKSIDMILCDLPYGTTACKWDVVIPFEPLWAQYKRIIKDNGAIVLFGSEPFSSALRMSNIKDYKYDWIWNKKLGGNSLLVKKQPYKIHEIISVFNSKIYFPIMEIRGEKRSKNSKKECKDTAFGDLKECEIFNNLYYPKSILEISNANRNGRVHPTQKPVALLEYLIKTYTNEGELVLDNCAGSGTTAIACLNTNRQFIVMEKEQKYYDIILKRVEDFNKNFEPQTLFGNEM